MAGLHRHRYDNAIRVTEALWRSPGMSRSDLARDLRLDRSTTGSLIDYLISRELVTERPLNDRERKSIGGGRPPLALTLNGKAGFSVGAELSAPAISLVATDLNGRRIADRAVATPKDPNELSSVITNAMDGIVDEAEAAIEKSGARSSLGLLTFAAGVSGVVNTDSGSIMVSRDLHINDSLDIATPLQQTLGVPVWIFNDADACALSEIEYGPSGDNDLLFVLANIRLGSDIGSSADTQVRTAINAGLGIVLDGHLRHAHSGGGREFRSPFLSADSQEQFLAAVDYYSGRATATEVTEQLAEELGISVAFLVHALDIRTIVIGGDLCRPMGRLELFEERIREHISHDSIMQRKEPLVIREPAIEPRPIAFGASAGAVRRLFENRQFPVEGSNSGKHSASLAPETGESEIENVPKGRNL